MFLFTKSLLMEIFIPTTLFYSSSWRLLSSHILLHWQCTAKLIIPSSSKSCPHLTSKQGSQWKQAASELTRVTARSTSQARVWCHRGQEFLLPSKQSSQTPYTQNKSKAEFLNFLFRPSKPINCVWKAAYAPNVEITFQHLALYLHL